MDYSNPGDSNHFFYSGVEDIDVQIESEVMQALLTRKRSLFYWRSQGAGIPDYENLPITAQNKIAMAYDSVIALTKRNATVTNGQAPGTRDMRVAVSQSSVKVISNDQGEMEVQVLYIPLHSLVTRKSPSIPLAGR